MISFPASVSLLAACFLGTQVAFGLDGMIGVHDPSSIIKCDGSYYLFGTGRGISILTSKNSINWERNGRVFERIPESVKSYVPKNDGVDVWAPEIVQLNGQYHLYYSVSTWGQIPSAIGLATSPTLNPQAPNYHWTDRGMVVHSVDGQHFNAIDPGIVHGPDGRLWLCYGSYLGTIELVELNPKTGLRIAANSPVVSIASQSEAANLTYRDGFYYLFVNHGTCCAGVNSTYHIRVGRAKNVTGPYLDRHGEDLMLGAGSLFLASAAGQIGPGHFSRFCDNGVEKFSIHYEGELGSHRRPFLAILPLLWSSDGWPTAGQDIKAGIYQLCSDRTGSVLQTPSDAGNGNRLETAAYLSRPNQHWRITTLAGGYFSIANAASGKALMATRNGTVQEVDLAQTNGTADPTQRWQIDQLTDGTYRIASSSPPLVLTTGKGNSLVLEPFSNRPTQRWIIRTP